MKKLLYIGHAYHTKTQSTDFLCELLAQKYEIEHFAFDPYSVGGESEHFDIDAYKYFDVLKGRKYDIVVLFQVMPKICDFKKIVDFNQGVFFPMYDGSGGLPDSFWLQYEDFKIINFSCTLHKRLLNMGLNSYYIQYFTQPFLNKEMGDIRSIFFWQRIANINIATVERLLQNISYDHIHLHKALDPEQVFIEPSSSVASKLTYSTWYDNKADMLGDIEKAAIYIAPREYEGIGMSFLEAMAMGRCVVAPNNPTMNEYITHNETGILYDSNNVNPLKEFDVKKIQRQTLEYIKKGYDKWKKARRNIFVWLEEPLKTKSEILNSLPHESYNVHKVIFGFIPISVIENNTEKVWSLFSFIPVLKKKNTWISLRFFYLFGFLPLIMKESYNVRQYDLFGFITLLKIKKITNKEKWYFLGFFPVKTKKISS